MKKSITLFALMLVTATFTFAQTRNRSKIAPIEVGTPVLKNAPVTESITPMLAPTVYTNETAFIAAIKNDYLLDEFSDILSHANIPSLIRTTGNYTYMMTEPGSHLYGLEGAIGLYEAIDSILVTNTGAPVYAFGGYFSNTNIDDAFVSGDVQIKMGTYTYTFTAPTATTFVGFVFFEAITSVVIKYPTNANANAQPHAFTGLDHFYWGSVNVLPTSVANLGANRFSIYPNPTSDVINLSSVEGIQSINITTLTGNTVWSGSVFEFPLKVTSFAKGIYLVNLVSANGVKTAKVIIK